MITSGTIMFLAIGIAGLEEEMGSGKKWDQDCSVSNLDC
jgi:hypothetical protein